MKKEKGERAEEIKRSQEARKRRGKRSRNPKRNEWAGATTMILSFTGAVGGKY